MVRTLNSGQEGRLESSILLNAAREQDFVALHTSKPYSIALLVRNIAKFQALLQGVVLEMKMLRTSAFIADQVALHSPHHEETPSCSTALAAGAILRRSGGQCQCQ